MSRIKYDLPVTKESGKSTQYPNKLMRGKYSGLNSTAKQIAEYIPKCKIYVEPFAGLGRLTKYIQADQIILNDMSDFAYEFLSKNKNCVVTQIQFEDIIKKHDSENTFFLFDPPWRTGHYQDNDLPFCDRKAFEYYEKLFELVPNLKGDWILCCDKKEMEIKKICSKSKYDNLIIDSNQKLFGRTIGVMLTSNKPFKRYHQTEITQ